MRVHRRGLHGSGGRAAVGDGGDGVEVHLGEEGEALENFGRS